MDGMLPLYKYLQTRSHNWPQKYETFTVPLVAMISFKLLPFLFLQMFFTAASMIKAAPANPKLFREYIGAENKGVTFTEVPVDSKVEFHFILSFAIDYTTQSINPSPTNGDFNVFWDTENLTPANVSAIKARHPNAKVALSLGGDTVGNKNASFNPKSINSWVRNAVYSLTQIIRKYHLDGIDIDYEHFQTDPNTFAECIGRLLFSLKQNNIVSFTSIAPYDDDSVQRNYLALWRKYGHLIDYVNFQFYAYDNRTTTTQFLKYFEMQSSNYKGGKILVSFGTDNSGGLSPEHGFFAACTKLNSEGKLHGIFIWSADDSKKDHFRYEKQAQAFLSSVN